MRLLHLLSVLSVLAIAGCAADNPVDHSALDDASLLEQAYLGGSQSMLDEFFRRWQAASVPIGGAEYATLDDTVRSAYELFTAFYDPIGLANAYDDDRYIVVQGRIFVLVIDGNLDSGWIGHPKLFERRIENFRPVVNIPGRSILSLSDRYDSLLNVFLGGDARGRWQRDFEEIERRVAFLDGRISVLPGHWGFGFHIASHPHAQTVFDRRLRQGEVGYQIGYGGTADVWELRQEGWRYLRSTGLYWRE